MVADSLFLAKARDNRTIHFRQPRRILLIIDVYKRQGAVWPGLTGAGIGALGAVWLSNEWISRLFALLILIVGIKELFGKKESG